MTNDEWSISVLHDDTETLWVVCVCLSVKWWPLYVPNEWRYFNKTGHN